MSNEIITRATADAILPRITRSLELLTNARRLDVWEAEMIAQSVVSLAQVLEVGAVTRPKYGSQSLALVDAKQNLRRLLALELFGRRVPDGVSVLDVLQIAREMERACRCVAKKEVEDA